MPRPKKIKITIAALLVAGVAAVGYFAVSHDLIPRAIALINENTPVPLFIALMIILPIIGVPITPFLLVLGIKFGLARGILLMVLIMPVHMIISFALTRIAGDLVLGLLSRGSYTIPRVPADKQIRFSFVVAAVPLLPYAVKNFLMPLAGIPFRLYLAMNWSCQTVLALPAVVLGSSVANLNPWMFILALVGMAILYLVISWIERTYGRQMKLKDGQANNTTTI